VDTWTSFIGARTVITVRPCSECLLAGLHGPHPTLRVPFSRGRRRCHGRHRDGGKISQVDPTVGTASCMYTSGALQIGVIVHQYSSGAEAQKEVASQLKDHERTTTPGKNHGRGRRRRCSVLLDDERGFEMSAAMSAHVR